MTDIFQALHTEFTGHSTLPWPVVVVRIFGALVLSAIIGFEREARDHAAGLRTHMLVGLAASCYCLLALDLVGRDFGDDVRMDPVRMIEAVTGGVAFLAAGLIVFTSGKVKGLTTGASLWLVAAIGTAAGLGVWLIAMMATGLSLFIVGVLRSIERRVGQE
ncbi:MAG: MgtC/SapB family protein [Pseudomonadota bacterium]|uniref:MgtC/SapB family protein n=1 Tax=Pseudooceanicola nitratireducens TaxID=517719 RepID=UPI002ECDCBFD|nr:MgtC/SapB family protein [Pseudomonadota bacterium]